MVVERGETITSSLSPPSLLQNGLREWDLSTLESLTLRHESMDLVGLLQSCCAIAHCGPSFNGVYYSRDLFPSQIIFKECFHGLNRQSFIVFTMNQQQFIYLFIFNPVFIQQYLVTSPGHWFKVVTSNQTRQCSMYPVYSSYCTCMCWQYPVLSIIYKQEAQWTVICGLPALWCSLFMSVASTFLYQANTMT